jgi:hypothetical protein
LGKCSYNFNEKGKICIITKEFYLLGYNAVLFVETQPMFLSNMSSPSSGLKSKLSKNRNEQATKKKKYMA